MKKLVLNQITLCADGSIGLQWLKQVVDPSSGEVLVSEPHRSVVDFDGDAETQVGLVSDHLAGMGYPEVSAEMLALIVKIDRVGKADASVKQRRAEKVAQRDAAQEYRRWAEQGSFAEQVQGLLFHPTTVARG